MVSFASSKGFILAGVAAGLIMGSQLAGAAVDDTQIMAEAVARPTEIFAATADLEMRYVQEDGPDSGHVRVLLTPESRPLTVLEARSAAQQAFLEALTEPGLGDNLSKITVVVRLMPASYVDPGQAEQVFHYLFKGGRDWSVLPGE